MTCCERMSVDEERVSVKGFFVMRNTLVEMELAHREAN